MVQRDNITVKKFLARFPHKVYIPARHKSIETGISINQVLVDALEAWVNEPATAPRTKRQPPTPQS